MRLPLAALALVLSLAGCGLVDDSEGLTRDQREAFEQEIDAADRALTAAIGRAEADDIADCRVLGLDGYACGSPTYFLVYSAADGDSTVIVGLATRRDSLNRAYDEALGVVRECREVTPPVVVIEDGSCQTEPEIVVD